MGTNAIGSGVLPPQQGNKVEVPRTGAATVNASQPQMAPQQGARAPEKPTSAVLQKAVDQANQVLQAKTSNEMQFSIVKGAGIEVVKMVSTETGETVMQFPSEAMIEIAKTIDQVSGAIIKTKA